MRLLFFVTFDEGGLDSLADMGGDGFESGSDGGLHTCRLAAAIQLVLAQPGSHALDLLEERLPVRRPAKVEVLEADHILRTYLPYAVLGLGRRGEGQAGEAGDDGGQSGSGGHEGGRRF
jgi:hypothetical protein